jgi:selenide,water dikinase
VAPPQAIRRNATARAGDALILLTDPQTSGGLLVACAPERAEGICRGIVQAGYPLARIIGRVTEGEPMVRVR